MQTQEAVDLLRRQRHDYTNHLQVLRGYLELDQASRALEYILKISQELARERKLFLLEAPEVSIFLYRMYLAGLERGLTFEARDIQPAGISGKLLDKCEREITKIYDEIGHLPAAQREGSLIELSLNQKTLRVEVTLESGTLIREIVLTR